MKTDKKTEAFLAQYDAEVYTRALQLRELLLNHLPGITEQVDLPAKMIMYTYGQKYSELISVIIPSKKGLKLGFNRGNELLDPDGLLEGKGKISRYVVIKSDIDVRSAELKKLVLNALELYTQRKGK
jgi:hypothetical protein